MLISFVTAASDINISFLSLSTGGMFSRMSSSSAVRDRRVGVPFAAESIKSQSQLNRESVGDNAMMVCSLTCCRS